jgi:hypothetical protein
VLETEDHTMTESRKRSPRHLSDTALIVLGRAADSENQMILPVPKTVKARGKATGDPARSEGGTPLDRIHTIPTNGTITNQAI